VAAAVKGAGAGAGTAAGARGAEAVRRVGLALVLAATALAVAPAAPARGGASVEVRASKHGFEPSRLTLRRGESVRIVLSSVDAEHCFAIDTLRIEKRIVPGRTTTFEIAPDRAGVFPFYCCLESGDAAAVERGQLTVTE
jgi:heme/copper-type cytochrome/quinol oxidase subunit 2